MDGGREEGGGGITDKIQFMNTYIYIYQYIHIYTPIEIENGMSFAFHCAYWGKVLTALGITMKKRGRDF